MRVTIERLGHHGDGIAAGPVFVPRTLPGEVVEGAVAGDRIEAPKIVTPSPDRVRAPCPHARGCGGCSLQHASDAFVANWKTEVVRTALAAQDIDATPAGIDTSPPRSRRRAVLSARRTRGGSLIGFHAPRSEAIQRIPECHLLHPALLATMPALEALVEIGASRKGTLRLAVVLSEGGPDVAVSGGKPLDPGLIAELAAVVGAQGLARLTWDGEPVALAHPAAQRFGRGLVVVPPGAFLQATAEGEAALRAAVRVAVGGAARVIDLFSGSGTFALPLAETAQVHAVESEAEALAALDLGWRNASGLKRVTTEPRDLYRRPMLADELDRFDAIVIDPPRAGAEAQAAEIARSSVDRIAAVSCNPVTFARDARLLIAGGFRLDGLRLVDQFRWSTHIELAAQFSR